MLKTAEKKSEKNMKDDDELEMLLGEIPHVTSSFNLQHMINNTTTHHHHHHLRNNHVDHGDAHASCVTQTMNGHGQGCQGKIYLMDDDESLKNRYAFASSPVSGFSLQSDGSSSSLLSSGGGRSNSDIGSLSPPQLEELKPHLIPGNGFSLDSKKAGESNLVDYLNLSTNFSKMYIRDEPEGVSVPPYSNQFCDQSPSGATRSFEKYGASDDYRNGFTYRGGLSVSVPRKPMSLDGESGFALVEIPPYDKRMANLLGSRYSPSPSDRLFCWSDFGSSTPGPPFYRNTMLANNSNPMGFVVSNASPSLDNPSVGNPVFYSAQNRMNLIAASDSFYSSAIAQVTPLIPHYNDENLSRYQQSVPHGRNKVPLRVTVPQGSVEAFAREDALIMDGEGVNYGMTRHTRPRVRNTKNFHHENGAWKTQEKRPQLNGRLNNAAIHDRYPSPKMHCPFNRPPKFSSLDEAKGYIYHIAKDQQGCRFLQRMFDEGTSLDVHIIFSEIIGHAVELMMNPFGNYLMQKLLEVCNEEQRMHILFKVTEEPGELVRISLNTHGTRVVQKLIETLKTKQQISLVISALEPGFLALIKDLNGNHVIQRCLQCFPSEDSKFIFVASAKYCVDIATHQHGCCVLQRCISHSTGEHRENLIAEISANGLLLAEDAFGNYVVQFILELKIPYATSKLTSQFEGNYVHLSTQKFSSHVVEKCLLVCNGEALAKIIHELLSATCFDQLLQDPHANYVVQTALRVSEGHLHNSLVDAIESYKAISRNSPYSKRIFSQKLLKR